MVSKNMVVDSKELRATLVSASSTVGGLEDNSYNHDCNSYMKRGAYRYHSLESYYIVAH